MSREILFRGKDKRHEEWVESKSINQFINPYTEKSEIHLLRDGHGWWVCYIETVGQYTGLTDCNGKRIFEGDIVSGLFLHSLPVNGVVAFANGSFGLLWNRAGAEMFWAFTSICNVEYQVIGNIHDNPELLN